jgi:hypothetical protein
MSQQLSNLRQNRFLENLAVHRSKMTADANSDGARDPRIDIVGTDRPFGKRRRLP